MAMPPSPAGDRRETITIARALVIDDCWPIFERRSQE